ncbi:MAG: MFS transporter [Clostridia bacterium]|nr:MFS transporter [Clostridia bacterium]
MEELSKSTKRSNVAYIIEAMLEYFIALAVSGTYLTHVMTYIEIPSSVQGVINSIISLGCGFQFLSIVCPIKKAVKRTIIILHSISQILFSFVFFVPLFSFPFEVRVSAFILSLGPAYIIHNYINAPKIAWCMSHVNDSVRGKFTANKEIVSLLGGMAFSFSLGALIDFLEAGKMIEIAFTIIGGLIVLICIGHTISLIFVDEKANINEDKPKVSLISLLKNKQLMKVIPIFIVWDIAHYVTISFAAAYQNNTLGFTPLAMTLISVGGSLVRILFSRPLGKFADKYSFIKMLTVCFISHTLGFITIIFTVPIIGYPAYILYSVFSQIGNVGIASSQINLIYDYVQPHERSGAFAFSRMFSGFAGFFATLAVSPLYDLIGDSGLSIGGGFVLYPLPVMGAISAVIMIALLIYIYFGFLKKKKKAPEATAENSDNNA